MEQFQTVLVLSHLLYETCRACARDNAMAAEAEKKVALLEKQSEKMLEVHRSELGSKKVDVLGDIVRCVAGQGAFKADRELESHGISAKAVEFALHDVQRRVEEARRAQQEAARAAEALYALVEPVRGDWTGEAFVAAVLGAEH